MSGRTLSHPSPVLAYDFLSRCNFSTPSSTHLYSSINRLYAQNPVFAFVHDESVKVYLHMFNGNVKQNPLCVESCVSEEFSISPRMSRTIFDPDANSVFLRAHLCTAVDFMRRNCSREREDLYNGNVQQNPVFEIVHDESVKVIYTCTTGMFSRTLYA